MRTCGIVVIWLHEGPETRVFASEGRALDYARLRKHRDGFEAQVYQAQLTELAL